VRYGYEYKEMDRRISGDREIPRRKIMGLGNWDPGIKWHLYIN